PLCILQRVAVMAFTLAAAVCLLLPTNKKGGRLAASLLMSVPAVWGGSVAVYQIWLQSLPPEMRPSCGAPWTFRLRDWPLFDYWEFVVRGLGDCGTREWILGLPLPVWSVLFFAFALITVWFAFFKAKR
ncbi:MAG: disulfide bond formation protein B, partial [Neisseria sp.]|nr:disulfide bond formation protein B [Neisseria sp.]